jgi:ABC-type branched-subunit amino acid transport system substrate-binding protein
MEMAKKYCGVLTLVFVMFFALAMIALPECEAKPKEIVFGATISLTGPAAGFGEGGVFGLKAAVEDINKLGGIYIKEYDAKLPVKLIVLDNESDPIKAGTLAQDLLVRDKVDFLVASPQWPQIVAAVATAAERQKTPFVAFAGPFEPNNALREAAGPWKYTWESGFAIGMPAPPGDFRNAPGYTMMDIWFGFLDQVAGRTNKKVGAFASDDPDGRGWYEAFTGAVKKAGFDVLGADKDLGIAALDTTDFSPMIRKWKANNCEILLGNAPAPWFGTMWRQCKSMGYKPKVLIADKAAMMYEDVMAWGDDLPWGIAALIEWLPTIKAKGIGDTTPVSLDERWKAATGQPTHQLVGPGYCQMQVYMDAIERAGTLDKEKVNKAIGETDIMTIRHRMKFDKYQFSRLPVCLGQWFKVDTPAKFEFKVIYSPHDFYPVQAKPIFPLP